MPEEKKLTPKQLTAWAAAVVGILGSILLVVPRLGEAIDEITTDPALSLQIAETQLHFPETPVYGMTFEVPEGDVRLRSYSSDGCLHIALTRDSGMTTSFFLPRPPLSNLTMRPPTFSAGLSEPGCRQSEACLYMDPQAHGHYEVEEIGWQEDWLLLDYHYEDGCKERVAIHPSGTTASVGWPCCVH